MSYYRQSLTVGSLAYLDTFAGPVPCKVITITHDQGKHGRFLGPNSDISVTVVLTATRDAYLRGERISGAWSLYVIPRKSLRANRIMPYDVVVPEPVW